MNRRMVAAWLLLAVVAAGLSAWERSLSRSDAEARQARHRIGRLVPSDEREGLDVAALTVGRMEGPRWRYVRESKDLWRCIDHHGAVADARRVEALIRALLDAEGVVVTRDETEARDLGLGKGSTWVVVLHGPGFRPGSAEDRRLEVRLGLPLATGRGCYVRRGDEEGVWRIDTDPWGPLDLEHARDRPPLLDPHVVPAYWLQRAGRVERTEAERADGLRFAMTLHDVQITQEEFRAGKSPFEYRLHRVEGGEEIESTPNPKTAAAWSTFLFVAPWRRVLGASEAAAAGLDAPRARVVLHPRQGDAIELRVGSKPLADGRFVVSCSASGLRFAVDRAIADLLVPDLRVFDPDFAGDPFRPYFDQR